MPTSYYHEWRPIRIHAHGLEPRLAKHWNCLPAWNIDAFYDRADEYVPYPEVSRAVGQLPKDSPFIETGMPVYWDRHIDRRYHLEYPAITKDTPRSVSRTVGDTDKDWDTLIAHRDRVLAAAGLTLDSPKEAIAKAIADTFKWESPFYHTKPEQAVIGGEKTRQLHHPVESVLHQSFCVGCANAHVALAAACGIPARNVGTHGHYAAEFLIDGRWRYVENTCRHPDQKGLEAFFPEAWMDLTTHPERFMKYMPAKKAGGYWNADNGDYCLMGASWRSPLQLLFAADCAYALYPEHERWGIKGLGADGRRLPLVWRIQGFIWMDEAHGGDNEARRELRRRTAPFPFANPSAHRTFLYQPLKPGDRLRHSFWLGALDDMKQLTVTVPFAPETHVEFNAALGRQLFARVGDWRAPLAAAGTWPPSLDETSGHLHCTITAPREALRAHAVNWFELQQESRHTMQHPVTPAALEPYIAPLWTETR